MTDKLTLSVQKRQKTGNQVKALRRQGMLPANIFGKEFNSVSIELSQKDFMKMYRQAGETSVIHITIDKDKTSVPVLISDAQEDPVTGEIIHADFQKVDLTQKTTATVPVEIIGRSLAEDKGGILFTVTSELEVEALPSDLPESIQVDIATLEDFGDTITVADLKTSSLYEIQADEDQVLVQVQEPKEEPQEDQAEESSQDSAETAPAEEEAPKNDQPEEDKTE